MCNDCNKDETQPRDKTFTNGPCLEGKSPVEDEPTKTDYTKSHPFDKVWIVKLDSMMSTRVM